MASQVLVVEPAGVNDGDAIAELLRGEGLPVPNAADAPVTMLVLRDGRRIIGCAGYERYGRHALVRSVAVSEQHRRYGHGARLVRALLNHCLAEGVKEFFLGNSVKPRLSVGIGVNWVSPFGPLRIDIAKALLTQEGDETKLFSFNVGTQF